MLKNLGGELELWLLFVQVPTVVPEAKKALEQGCAVVIGLQTTGEAAADSMGLEPGQSCGSVSTTKQMLRHFVATHFPLKRETQKNGGPLQNFCIFDPDTATSPFKLQGAGYSLKMGSKGPARRRGRRCPVLSGAGLQGCLPCVIVVADMG